MLRKVITEDLKDAVIIGVKENPFSVICATAGVAVFSGLMYLTEEQKPLNGVKSYFNNMVSDIMEDK